MISSVIQHRKYIGGKWEEIGRLQFNFMVSRGLRPKDYLLDVGCGSLRGGVHFIKYLEKKHYFGMDKEYYLLKMGIERELGKRMFMEKRPITVVSSNFEFDKFPERPDYAIAQSLFTHLPAERVMDCLSKLRGSISSNGVFYTTFFETNTPVSNPSEPHDHYLFKYTRKQMKMFGIRTGWNYEYIGDWNHPRNQKMMK